MFFTETQELQITGKFFFFFKESSQKYFFSSYILA